MGQRRRAREFALQMLFQLDLTGTEPEELIEPFWRGIEADDDVRTFAEELLRGVAAERDELDRRIVAAADNWRLERMAVVDRNVLRMAIWELLHADDAPAAVVLDEAISIAKKFGSESSGSFINGVLDAVRRKIEAGELT